MNAADTRDEIRLYDLGCLYTRLASMRLWHLNRPLWTALVDEHQRIWDRRFALINKSRS